MSVPDLAARLSALYQTVDARLAVFKRLLQLSGASSRSQAIPPVDQSSQPASVQLRMISRSLPTGDPEQAAWTCCSRRRSVLPPRYGTTVCPALVHAHLGLWSHKLGPVQSITTEAACSRVLGH